MVEDKIYVPNLRFLDLQVNHLKLANPMASCRTYLDCILFEIGGVFNAWLEMQGQSILIVYGPI